MNRPVRILVIEDNPADALLVEEALRDGKLQYRLQVAEDGISALKYLRREGEFSDALLPDLIFLDLNLPKKDGREVLGEIKADPVLHQIPVLVLTTSNSQADISQAYRLHANCYLTKAVDFESFWQTVRAIEEFWLTFARLPELSAQP